MNDFNSTELFGGMSMEEGSGEQENVVDSPESRYGGTDADGDGHERFVDSQEDGGDEEGSDAGEGASDPDGADQGRAKKQTREENAAIRAARLRAEHDTAARMRAAADERIARSRIMNPATGRPFKNMQELETFGAAQREAEMQRTAARQAAERQAFLVKDAQEFRQQHPEVDIGKLEKNESFRKFCGSRYGVESLASLYDDYRTIVGGAEKAGRAVAESRSRRSTGSGGGGGEMLSAAQRASLEAWNRDNPDMKMTAKEFLAK